MFLNWFRWKKRQKSSGERSYEAKKRLFQLILPALDETAISALLTGQSKDRSPLYRELTEGAIAALVEDVLNAPRLRQLIAEMGQNDYSSPALWGEVRGSEQLAHLQSQLTETLIAGDWVQGQLAHYRRAAEMLRVPGLLEAPLLHQPILDPFSGQSEMILQARQQFLRAYLLHDGEGVERALEALQPLGESSTSCLFEAIDALLMGSPARAGRLIRQGLIVAPLDLQLRMVNALINEQLVRSSEPFAPVYRGSRASAAAHSDSENVVLGVSESFPDSTAALSEDDQSTESQEGTTTSTADAPVGGDAEADGGEINAEASAAELGEFTHGLPAAVLPLRRSSGSSRERARSEV